MPRSILDILERERTPARPGPGLVTNASLRALELVIARRIDGLITGDYRATTAGLGTELYQVRPYEPGDDVRMIDWNVTARTGVTHVRVHVAERQLVTWIVLDGSASMGFGTADRRKADVAEGVAIAVGIVASRRGGRLGVVAFGAGKPRFRRPRQGRLGLLDALKVVGDDPEGSGGLEQALRIVDGLAIQRGTVIVISDFRGPLDWQQALVRVASRHQTLAVEIHDPREQAIVDIGELRLTDPETGQQIVVDTHDPAVREEFAQAAAEERRALVLLLAALGVPYVAVSTEGDWLRPLAAFLARGDRS